MKLNHWIALGVVNALFLLLDFRCRAGSDHSGLWWNSIPLFYILYGFVGCVLIVLVAKFFGSMWLQKNEDYYDVR